MPMKQLYKNKVKNQGRKLGAKIRVCTLLAPYTRALALGHSAQVRRKLSHEQNHLMRTKVCPAPGKTSLVCFDMC
jgi:hypothetical protein